MHTYSYADYDARNDGRHPVISFGLTNIAGTGQKIMGQSKRKFDHIASLKRLPDTKLRQTREYVECKTE